MKNSTYQEMLIEYENDLDSYKYEREVLFSKYKYSIILEGEFTELENLESWIKENIDINYCEQNNPKIVETLKKKTFSELWDLDIKHKLFDKFDCSIIIGSTSDENSIMSYDGWIFKNFQKKN